MHLTLEMFDSLGVVLWEMDSRGLNLVAISDQVEAMSGHPTSRWLDASTSFLDFVHVDDRPGVLDAFTRAIERCTWDQLEFRIAAGTGVRWIRSTFRGTAAGSRLVGTMADVTEWHELRQREHRYRAIVTNSADAIALLDRDGTIRFVTEAVERISGYTATELTGRNAFEQLHPDDRTRVRDAFLSALTQPGVPLSVEYRARHKDGSWHHREVIGVNRLDDPDLASIIVNYRDTTARRQVETALAERERVHQSTFDEALIGIAHSSLDGRFLLVNRRLCDLLGYTPEELTANDFMTLSHPDEVGQDIDARARLMAGAIHRYTREKRYRRKDGSFVWTNLTVSVHRDVTGEPAYFIAIIEDLTERKHLEQQVREAHKMEAVGRLAGGIAHDFNNLLTAILGYADLALRQLSTAEKSVRDDIEEIRAAGKSAALLTRQLLTFSRRQILQPQVVDLNIVVTRMTGLLRRLIGENIDVTWRLATPLDRVSADPSQIEQVVLNLALNARDAMPQGGALSIETSNVELDAAYTAEHSGATIGPHVMLAISDTGVGMDDGVREHVFEPFYTTKGLGLGTGLGLATVYGIVKQSGGSIVVYSEPRQGTTFEIFLPRTYRVEEVVTAPSLPPATLDGTETVLVVEDQSEVRSVIRETLTRHGYTVVEAANGLDALAAIGQRAGPIHLLLTDVVMPGMSGPALARQFVRDRPEVRVLYMSGYTNDGVEQREMLEPGAALIQKPFSPDVLLRRVREVLADVHVSLAVGPEGVNAPERSRRHAQARIKRRHERHGSATTIGRVQDLTTGSIPRHLLKTASFMLVTMIFQTLYFLVDLYWVGRLGKEAVAGVGIAGNLTFIVLAVTQMLGVGVTTLVSHAAGQKDRDRAQLAFNQSLVLSVLVGLVFFAAGMGLRTQYVGALSPDARTLSLAGDYLLWFIPAMALQFPMASMGAALRGTGNFKPGMVVQTATVILNMALAPMLIFGWVTHVPLGVAGAAIASLVAIVVGTVWLSMYFRPEGSYLKFVPADWKPHIGLWKRMLAIGLPAGTEFGLMAVYVFVVYIIARPFGAAAQAGFGIGMRIIQASFMPVVALAFSVAPVAGQNFGAGRPSRVRDTFTSAAVMAGGFMLLMTILCQIAGDAMVGVFSDDPQVIAVGEDYLWIISWNLVAAGIVFVGSSMFQAMGNTLPPLAASCARIVAVAVPAFALWRLPGFELRWIWYLSVAGGTLQLVMSLLLLRREFRRRLTFAPAPAMAPTPSRA